MIKMMMKEKRNYNCDITYATNSELDLSFRDNMKYWSKNCSKSSSLAIVDEIDSCLIDEARTPL